MKPYSFPLKQDFLNRSADLLALEDWWSGRDRNALALYGRRRVGKSWLFRAFAHGKPTLILVSDRRTEASQLDRFAKVLKPFMGVEPRLRDVPSLFETLYRLAREQKLLVVIDELPYLLPTRADERNRVLTGIQAEMEARDESQLKLILCGSHISQMRTLLGEGSPLHGRLTPLPVYSLNFAEAQAFGTTTSPRERIERYAVTGGMSLYLSDLAGHSDFRRRVCSRVLDPRGPMFSDPREVLEDELREPSVYFSLLEELSWGERNIGNLATALGKKSSELSFYLKTLEQMRLVKRIAPVTAGVGFRDHHYCVADNFLRFWFRFVFDFQDELRSGLNPEDHYDGKIAEALPEHVANVFESLCRQWVRKTLGRRANHVGKWWGKARHDLRKSGERQSEEIDIVGTYRSRSHVTLVGECKWTSGKMTAQCLADLEEYKMPALRQADVKFSKERPLIVLFARSGFKQRLVDIAEKRQDVRLVALDELVNELIG